MLFTELRFFLWLVLSLVVFWLAPPRLRAAALLVLSLGYWLLSSLQGTAWLAITLWITWAGGRKISSHPVDSTLRAFWLKGTVALLAGMLVAVKFGSGLFPVLTPWVAGEGSMGGLPMGISYYTFHCLGYLLDVYWAKEKLMPVGALSLYLSFFPKALMGPIERSGGFQQQTETLPEVRWSFSEARVACFQICCGMFMKFVLADRIKLFVDSYFQSTPGENAVPGLLAAVAFCWQLYYDFFSYSLIAVGAGGLLGFKLCNNFNRPFYAPSISDFWNRWHISLSSWFQTYFYTPLRFQLRRHRKRALIVAGMCTFLAIGVWHGTGWTWVLFGLFNGVPVTLEALYPKLRQAPSAGVIRGLRVLLTFLIVAVALVLFRAPSLSMAGSVYAHFLTWEKGSISAIIQMLPKFDWLLICVMALVTEVLTARGVIEGGGDGADCITRLRPWQSTLVFGLILAMTWALGVFGKTTFLYNQF
jgi:alginate O-acetyltransferase complex protein AlgI